MQGQPTHRGLWAQTVVTVCIDVKTRIRKNLSIWASRAHHLLTQLLWDVEMEAKDSKAAMPKTTW